MDILNEINVIVVAIPFLFVGGGGYRALLSIKEYKKRGINPYIVLPWGFQFFPLNMKEKSIHLLREVCDVCGSAILPKIFNFSFPRKRSLLDLLVSYFPNKVKIAINVNEYIKKSQCVMSMHEGFDSITTSLAIGEKFSLKKIAMLQLPPFYEDKDRIRNIEEAYRLWLEAVRGGSLVRKAWIKLQKIIDKQVLRSMKLFLNKFDLILAISKSIPMEMGDEWFRKVVSLDPGVALSLEDIGLISGMVKECKKERIVIFGGRPISEKGVIEALMAWRSILKCMGRGYKLVITGNVQHNILSGLKEFCRKLDVENNVLFTGYVSRRERLSLVARAKMMLYPSHVDSFPFAVLEALHLNTPVVAYDIPALRIYYRNIEGVTLVRESDLEAFIQKSIEIMEAGNVTTEKPKFKSWGEIINEETNLIKKLILG